MKILKTCLAFRIHVEELKTMFLFYVDSCACTFSYMHIHVHFQQPAIYFFRAATKNWLFSLDCLSWIRFQIVLCINKNSCWHSVYYRIHVPVYRSSRRDLLHVSLIQSLPLVSMYIGIFFWRAGGEGGGRLLWK